MVVINPLRDEIPECVARLRFSEHYRFYIVRFILCDRDLRCDADFVN